MVILGAEPELRRRGRLYRTARPDASIASVLTGAPLLRGMAAAERAELIKQFFVCTLPRSAVIVDPVDGDELLYIVVEGRVRLSIDSTDGRQRAIGFIGPGEQFGELSIFDPGPRNVRATAATDVVVASISSAELRHWLAGHPPSMLALLATIARRTKLRRDAAGDLVFRDVTGRVAKQIVVLAGAYGVPRGDVLSVPHDLSQNDLADLSATSRESLNKVLADFAGRGWLVVQRKGLLVTNVDALRRRAR